MAARTGLGHGKPGDTLAIVEARESIAFSLPAIDDSDVEAVVRVLRSRWLTTGDECASFEADLSDYLGGAHVVAVSSCTHALQLCLQHLNLPAGARIGVSDWTFVSTALAAVNTRYQPVFLDVERDTLNLSPASLAEALAEGLDAVIGVHFGGSAFSSQIRELCAASGVPLIEDAAHAFGASDGHGLINGSQSTAACFSFYATKNVSCGEGGAIATTDGALADFARTFRLHGLSRDAWKRYRPDGAPLYDLVGPGMKANMPDLLAALGRSQLRRFGDLQARRRKLVDQYRQLLDEVPVTVIPEIPDADSADHLMVVLLANAADRPGVVQQLAAVGISTSVHFQPLHTFGWMAEHGCVGPSGVGTADALAGRALSLPLYPDLTEDEVTRICSALADALRA